MNRPGHNDRLGKSGEAEAVRDLEQRGFHVLEKRYACRGGEADLIARDGETLVFIEVKTRSGLSRGLPREAVTPAKQRKLARAAAHYCMTHGIVDRPLRFDVVEVVEVMGAVLTVVLIQNAFVPDEDF